MKINVAHETNVDVCDSQEKRCTVKGRRFINPQTKAQQQKYLSWKWLVYVYNYKDQCPLW